MQQPIQNPNKVREERQFDQTQLRETTHGKYVHRDYAAHFFRWGFLKRFIKSTSKILDVGCGQDKPVLGVLTASKSSVPKLYVGVDLNKLPKIGIRQWARWHDQFNFIARYQELVKLYGQFDVVVCYEVLEHMPKEVGFSLLNGLRHCCLSDGTLLLSTPVFNGKAARNHLYEWTIPELQEAMIKTNLIVEKRYGTFSSQREIKKVLTKEEKMLMSKLAKFYDNDVMACFLAPLHPDQARNNVWVCHPK